ncbi:MAG: hypothetical protein HY531_01045 [Chloroflexi bacterium]|nr:hypothetical protein [Chloroflexota bacterium]
MLKLGWFSTGRGEGSRNLLRLVHQQITNGYLAAQIEFVFCNRAPGEAEGSDQFHALVRSYGIPLVTLSSQRFRRDHRARRFDEVREQFDLEVLRRLEGYAVDLGVLAGYMLYTGSELCRRFTLINLHPALPSGPTGTWQEVMWQLIESRATETGAMVHLATEQWDRGPAITCCSFPLTGPAFDPLWQQIAGRTVDELKSTDGEELPLFQLIRQEGMKREAPLLLETIRAFAQGKIRAVNRGVVDERGQPAASQILNSEVEAWLRGHEPHSG